jgi:predicted regulator of Ras-like GTPase activity (Roadblock/LC7/MglB family)
MTMHGNLKDMTVVDLVQQACQDRKMAKLAIQHRGESGVLYFKDGNIVHSELGGKFGEEVFYQLMDWEDGEFNLDVGVASPQTSITQPWSTLLLEAARRQDEKFNHKNQTIPSKENKPMATSGKKKSEILSDAIKDLLEESTDIEGAAIVGTDGLIYSANVPQRSLDESMVGAASAAIYGISKRGIGQLKRGTFTQTLIQGDDGNIIVSALNEQTLFVTLTPHNVNLGMAFAEMREMTSKLREII